ncbi:MAG: ABC transporter substrate-binding protein [Alphaproteobacteria bacterium]
MTRPTFKTVTRSQGNNQALKDGTVSPRDFDFEFEEVPVLVRAFRRMVRALEFDICEMALTTYICAREHGVKFTALPIFLVRAFHHGAIAHNVKAGIASPKDLEGKRVGVVRGYTVTTGVWARSILQDEYGVDLSKITWVLGGDEHVADYRAPANVVPLEDGASMADMLTSGELAAAVGVTADHPDVAPLIPDALEAGLAAMDRRGLYPINHLMVVRDDVLAANPGLAEDIFETFVESKRLYLERLKAGAINEPTAVDDVHARVMEITGDPLPYGVAPNRKVLGQLIQHALTQKIITNPIEIDALFAESTLGLAG